MRERKSAKGRASWAAMSVLLVRTRQERRTWKAERMAVVAEAGMVPVQRSEAALMAAWR